MTYQDSKTDVRQLLRELETATTDFEMGLGETLEADPRQAQVMQEVRNMLLVVSKTHAQALKWLAETADDPDALETLDQTVWPMPLSQVVIPTMRDNDPAPPPPNLTLAARSLRSISRSATIVVPLLLLGAAVFVSADFFQPGPPPPPPMTETELAGWLVRIPAGTTELGTSPADRADVIDACSLSENITKRIHQEHVSHQRVEAFHMGRTEVTVKQWKRFTKATGHLTHAELNRGMGRSGEHWVRKYGYGWDELGDVIVDDLYPVGNLTRADAEAFCRWLSSETGDTYRLPTEAEWEYAARAGTSTRWATGNDLVDASRAGWNARNSDNVPHPVGQLPPNAWGLHDMAGGFWEWTSGTWAGRDHWVVMRGGGFRASAWLARPASRAGVHNAFTGVATGFRVVREIDHARELAGR